MESTCTTRVKGVQTDGRIGRETNGERVGEEGRDGRQKYMIETGENIRREKVCVCVCGAIR